MNFSFKGEYQKSVSRQQKWTLLCSIFKKASSRNNLSANAIWPSRSTQDAFFLVLPLVTDSWTHNSDCRVVSATEVLRRCLVRRTHLCLCLFVHAAFWQRHFESFFPVLVCFELFHFLFCFVLFFFSWCCRRIVNAQSGSRVWHGSCLKVWKKNKPFCWRRALMWIGNGRCGKRFPSDWDGLTVVIVMMHLLWFFFFPLHWKKW